MNSKYDSLPDSNQPRLPYLKYKYHLPPSRNTPHVHQDYYLAQQKYPLTSSVDRSAGRLKKRQRSFFDSFEEDTAETIARSLIEENHVLKQMLKESQLRVEQLEQALRRCQGQISCVSRGASREVETRNIQNFKEQILLMMDKNRIIENQLQMLRQIIPYSLSKYQPQEYQGTSKQNSFGRGRSGSLDSKRVSRKNLQQKQRQEMDFRKSQELLGSIKGMYFKIMGYQVESLKELWRWLKNMGYTYSNVRKWSLRVKSQLSLGPIGVEKCSDMLSEVVSIIV